MRFCDNAIGANRFNHVQRQKGTVDISLDTASAISKDMPALAELLFAKRSRAVVELAGFQLPDIDAFA